MRKSTKLALVIPALVLAPAAAFADHSDGSSCAYTSNQNPTAVGPNVVVYQRTGGGAGTTGSADEAVGVCTKGLPVRGSVEAGHSATRGWTWGYTPGSTHGFYLVVDGDKGNDAPLEGYVGVSNYNYCSAAATDGGSQGPDDKCANNADDNTNGGGGVGVLGVNGPNGSPLICGNSSGEAWDKTNRNGCYYP